jgi:CRISPR type III-B/RAMP module RAMP protein Cmr6
MPQIPIAREVAALIGEFAEGVQNRSLLLDKLVFHKKWGLEDFNANDAHRWSLMRMSDGGSNDLNRDAQKRADEARRLAARNPEKSGRLQAEANLAQRLASTQAEAQDARELRRRHSRRLVALVRSAFGERASITVAKLEGRLAINLADGLLQNAGICLDRLFGLPYIPGSAVKGVCRHAALAELTAAGGAEHRRLFLLFRRVFGTADNDFDNGELRPFRPLLAGLPENQKGGITFLPAHPVDDAKVVVDLTNVHYPLYYGGDRRRGIQPGKSESLAEEKPQPNPFPAVESGARFAFLLVLNGMDEDSSLLRTSEAWLEEALTIRGLGAKIASGYGWFSVDEAAKQEILEEEARAARELAEAARSQAEARAKTEAEARRLASLSPAERARDQYKQLSAEEFARKASELITLGPEDQKGFLAALLTPEKKETWKNWKKSDKPANKGRVEAIRQAAAQHGVKLP